MGSVGSIFLSQFGWHSVFIFHGIVALLWAYLWKFRIVLPEQLQKREQLALGNIKMVEASISERAHMLNVPWGAFSKHPAVWYVFCYHPVCFLLEMLVPEYMTGQKLMNVFFIIHAGYIQLTSKDICM